MIRVGIVGLGKIGLTHHAIINTHPDVVLAAACDTSAYLLDVLAKYCAVETYRDFRKMMEGAALDAVIVATPSRSHGEVVRYALERNIHIFVEKPFCLDPAEGRELTALAESKGLVGQVGYHCRFIAAFREAKRLIEAGAIGEPHSFRAETYGPVVLRPQGSTWRARRSEGGGCLYDYASHAIDLVNYLFGPPQEVAGTVLGQVFSRDVEDEVYATLRYASGLSGQLAANWSDESHRKMTIRLTAWGREGKVVADRQECQLYRRAGGGDRFPAGWSVRYTTELSPSVWFYLRGEEYSEQLDHFVGCVRDRRPSPVNSFASALATDEVIAMLMADASGPRPAAGSALSAPAQRDGLAARWRRLRFGAPKASRAE